MILIPGYTLAEEVFRSPSFIAFKAIRTTDARPVLVKLPTATADSISFQELENEFHLLSSCHLNGVLHATNKHRLEHTFLVELEYFDGINLQELLENNSLSCQQRLQVAVNLTSVIEELHNSRILHRDIRPLNFLVNPKTLEVRCIDLRYAASLTNTSSRPDLKEKILSGLEYLSPEQTGRLSLEEDERSDLYSLGITLYKLFTGHTPFERGDLNEFIHAHLAKQAPSPVQLNRQLPKQLSNLIQRLVEKKPEERYQTAKSLKLDLQECLLRHTIGGEIPPFPLGKFDQADRFEIPPVMYGREEALTQLLGSFERVKTKSEVVLIEGHSGTGKSTLVEEVKKSLPKDKYIFVAGKFDQYLKNVPYKAITNAFRKFIPMLARQPEETVTIWKEQLVSALGNLGQLVIDEIPELEHIIGKQPEIATIPSQDAGHRNALVFSKFIDVFARPGKPLVIFLDDLQWADAGSLDFLQQMATRESSHILLIGTYRTNEVSSRHPLFTKLEEIKTTGKQLTEIKLCPLSIGQTEALLKDTLSCPAQEIAPLADVVFTRTLGNPLFIHALLQSLYTNKLVVYHTLERKWTWQLDQVMAFTHSTSSGELISRKIQELSAQASQALSYAACIGPQFDLEVVASLLDKPAHEAAEDLQEAVNESLIIPVRHPLDKPVQGLATKKQYVFLHDQIQQAAYTHLPDELKKELHLSIGYRLLDSCQEKEVDGCIFEIVSHLNKGSSLITTEKEIIRIAQLNQQAGKKAQASTAFEVALTYFTCALNYLDLDSRDAWEYKKWTVYYPLSLSLHRLAAEMAYLTGKFEQASTLVNRVLPRVQTLQEKTDIHLLQIQSLIYEKKNEEAIAYALPLLKSLGVYFPSSYTNLHILAAFLPCKWILRGKTIQDLEKLPAMTNQSIGEAFRIIQLITAATHNTLPKLYPLLVLKMVYLSVKYGNAPQSPLAYVTYGAIVHAIQTDSAACFSFGQLALTLLKKYDDAGIHAKTQLIYQLINRPCKEHIHRSLEPLKQSFTTGIESGEIEYAVYASNSYCVFLLLSGKNLRWIKEEIIGINTLPGRLKHESSSTGNEALLQIVANFLGENTDPTSLNGTYFKEDEGFHEIIKTHQKSKLFICYLYKSILCYLLGKYNEGLKNANEASFYLQDVKGILMEPLYYFNQALLNFAMYTQQPNRIHLIKAQAYKKKVKKRAAQVPVNHLHQFYLLEAEYYKITQQHKEAGAFYDKAIQAAKENNHCHDEALAHELAGKYWLSRGQEREAAIYLTSALELYKKWDCTIKVDQLKEQYSALLVSTTHLSQSSAHSPLPVTSHNITSTFDLATLMKAATAISSEVVFDKLMEKLMKVVIENAGAQVGYFILQRSGELVVEARQSVEVEKVQLVKTPLNQSADLLPKVVQQVFATKETILINHAGQDSLFKEELAQLNHRVKSVLCIPTLNQGKLIGVLYLENNLATGAFTQDRVEILQLLAGQIAVSIENAILYENLEQKVLERTAKIQLQKEEIERQKQLVEEKSRFKEQFFANMSHEIRTPMTAIIGMSDLIFDTPLNGKQLEYAKGIKYSSENLLAIINDILDYSKIEAGKFSFVKKPFQVRDRLNRLSYILQCLAQEKGIELRISIDPQVSAQLIGDPLRLHQVLLNLASNAIKFTQQGYVEITVERMSATEKAENLCFTVRDTGIGIPEEKLHYIFETFTRIEDEVNVQASGTGLGLFIAKKLVEEQGGSMQVKSKVNQGTEFRFTLSFERSSASLLVAKSVDEQIDLRGTKVLLVEDTLFNQVVAEEILKKIIPEAEVTIAENGAIALQKLEGQPFDIVLMDVKMPVMDGYKASKIIRESNSFYNTIPILAFTANANPIEAEKCKQAGMDDYISKPIEARKLKEKIGKLLSSRYAASISADQ
jgi:predicted ATPase/signal transduction histidine kinase/CheY-like chemotaxis protein